MIVNRPEVRFKPLVFDLVQMNNLDLLGPGEEYDYLLYDDILFSPMGEVESGDYLVITREQKALHLKPKELERAFEPNTKDNWQEELLSVDERGFEWALAHMKFGLPVKRQDSSDVIRLVEGKYFTANQGEYWFPKIEDLTYENWQVALDFGDEE